MKRRKHSAIQWFYNLGQTASRLNTGIIRGQLIFGGDIGWPSFAITAFCRGYMGYSVRERY